MMHGQTKIMYKSQVLKYRNIRTTCNFKDVLLLFTLGKRTFKELLKLLYTFPQ